MGRFVQRAVPPEAEAAVRTGELDPQFQARFPALWEYLTLTAYGDGSARETSTLLVLVEEGQMKLCVNDRDARRSLWRACQSLSEGLEGMEQDLAAGSGSWRSWGPYKGGPRKKKS